MDWILGMIRCLYNNINLFVDLDEKCNDSTAEGILDKGYLQSRVPSEEVSKHEEKSKANSQKNYEIDTIIFNIQLKLSCCLAFSDLL